MRLTLAVPDLLVQDRAALAAVASLATLARFSGPPDVQRGTLDDFLVTPLGAGTAPLAALGAGYAGGASYVLRADPVSLVAGRSDVALAARIDDLDRDESQALIATLDAHFNGDGLAFHAPRPDAWFLEVAGDPTRDPCLSTTPLAVVRSAIYPHMPVGADAPKWRRWMSEMQMLLHEHPVNSARAARGWVPVTGIWISGGGRLVDSDDAPAAQTFAAAGSAGDVARGLALRRGNAVQLPPSHFSGLPTFGSAVVVLPRGTSTSIGELDRGWLKPAIAALAQGALDGLTLLADGQGVAAAWHAQRPSFTRRALATIARRPFVPPVAAGDDA